jgi:hypothetical protein
MAKVTVLPPLGPDDTLFKTTRSLKSSPPDSHPVRAGQARVRVGTYGEGYLAPAAGTGRSDLRRTADQLYARPRTQIARIEDDFAK